jgi:hypothetical protein
MKSATVKQQSQPLQSIIKRSKATRKERQTPISSNMAAPPSDEMLSELNLLGQQYPFCVNFKQKRHDPL